MAGRIPLFNLRLGPGRLIGREALRGIWSQACASNDIDVGATPIDPSSGSGGFIYTLSAMQDTRDLATVERRLRTLVCQSVPGSMVMLTRLV